MTISRLVEDTVDHSAEQDIYDGHNEMLQIDTSRTLEDIMNDDSSDDFLFILKDEERFYTCHNVALLESRGFDSPTWHRAYSYVDSEETPILEISKGDRLVTFRPADVFTAYRVTDSGFCTDNSLSFNKETLELSKSMSPAIKIDEIDGIAINDLDTLISQLSKKNAYLDGPYTPSSYYICGEKGTTFTGGYYRGTEYCEETIVIDNYYAIAEHELVLPVEKTKDGYFIINTNILRSGEAYLLEVKGFIHTTAIYNTYQIYVK